MLGLYNYLDSCSVAHFLLCGCKIQSSDLALDLAVERGLPKLLIGPDGMVLNTGVGKLVHTRGQFLQRYERNDKIRKQI